MNIKLNNYLMKNLNNIFIINQVFFDYGSIADLLGICLL